MHARIIVAGQHHYYGNVTRISATPCGQNSYLHLDLDAHPSRVHFWIGPGTRTSVLLAADGEAFTAALREEAAGCKATSLIGDSPLDLGGNPSAMDIALDWKLRGL